MGLLYQPSSLNRTSNGLRWLPGVQPAAMCRRGWQKLAAWLSLHPDPAEINVYTLTGRAAMPRAVPMLPSMIAGLVVAVILLAGRQRVAIRARQSGALVPEDPVSPGAALRSSPHQPHAPTAAGLV